jgi:hypothetical protein
MCDRSSVDSLTFRRRSQVIAWLCFLFALSGCKGEGTAPSGQGGDGGTGPTTELVTCQNDDECDDHLYCNGQERCSEGLCRRGKRVVCSDGIECTIDSCDEPSESCIITGPDEDQDGVMAASCLNREGEPSGTDCNDNDALSFPGNTEVCDPELRDEDCDPTTIGERDADRDGYNDGYCCNEQEDGKLSCGKDCDDHKANVNPESPEVCDFLDNDCNEEIDEGRSVDMYPDTDHDGHGDSELDAIQTCPGAVAFSLSSDDCDDSDPEVFKDL